MRIMAMTTMATRHPILPDTITLGTTTRPWSV